MRTWSYSKGWLSTIVLQPSWTFPEVETMQLYIARTFHYEFTWLWTHHILCSVYIYTTYIILNVLDISIIYWFWWQWWTCVFHPLLNVKLMYFFKLQCSTLGSSLLHCSLDCVWFLFNLSMVDHSFVKHLYILNKVKKIK